MKPFLFFAFISILFLSCRNTLSNESQNEQNSTFFVSDSSLSFGTFHISQVSNGDTIQYPMDFSTENINFRKNHLDSISLNESIYRLKEILPYYFKTHHKGRNFSLNFSDGILSDFTFKFDRDEIYKTLSKNKSDISINETLNQILLNSNFKDEINEILKPYNYKISSYSCEKVDFSLNIFRENTKISSLDSISFAEKPFIGFLNVKLKPLD